MIRYIQHEEIDKIKWDKCINNAPNGLIYGLYDYLDCMSKNWDALIFGDYEMVMPLTWNKKYGINYLYQPFFCASLGIFGNQLNKEIVKQFLDHIPAKFRYWNIYINYGNFYSIDNYEISERLNLVLDLKYSYNKLAESFSKNHSKNILLAKRYQLTIHKNIPVESIVNLAKDQSKKYSKISARDYHHFTNLFEILHKNGKAITYGVYTAEEKLYASAVFFFFKSRAYYILVGNHPRARNSGASHYLINEFIKDHAEQPLILDFEGSNISSIARFYKGFGATEEIYAGLNVNRLPAISKLFLK